MNDLSILRHSLFWFFKAPNHRTNHQLSPPWPPATKAWSKPAEVSLMLKDSSLKSWILKSHLSKGKSQFGTTGFRSIYTCIYIYKYIIEIHMLCIHIYTSLYPGLSILDVLVASTSTWHNLWLNLAHHYTKYLGAVHLKWLLVIVCGWVPHLQYRACTIALAETYVQPQWYKIVDIDI